MDPFEQERSEMVEAQIVARGVRDPRVLEAIRKVPRELFVTEELKYSAYEDNALPIEEEQTISQPFIVALMTELAQIKPLDKVLEIGTGSGYSAAVLSHLAQTVISIERHQKLATLAEERLKKLGCRNVTIFVGDGTLGHPTIAPYDAIIVTAGGPQIPPSLLKQLTNGGRLVIPVGTNLGNQRLYRVTRTHNDHYTYENLGSVWFVPLIGKEGW